MKKSDIAMIILIASLSVLLAYGVVSAIPMLKAPTKAVQVQTIEKYTADVTKPDAKIFNGTTAINPTVDVTIGNDSTSSQ
ncbi:hypothetical protein KBD87_04305 [Candidatus Saccharibacteria bacterium]|nr:hypothetical protein [Candidatus Saccharibacteria bacterium]